MSAATPEADPTSVVAAAIARVIGGDHDTSVRADTALADLGIDRLARVLLVDACLDSGISLDPQATWTALTVADLLASARPLDSTLPVEAGQA